MVFRGGTVLAASLCLLAAPAAAQETYRLDYVRKPGAEACPSEAAFRAAVSQEVGRNPFLPDASNLLTVVFHRSEKKIRVQIVAKPASGSEQNAPEHEKPAWNCAGLLQHAAFSAGMLIDPLEPPEPEQPVASPPPPQAPPRPSPRPSPPSAPTPAPTEQITPAPRSVPPIRLVLTTAGGAAFGSTPGLSPSLTVGVGLRQGPLSVSTELRYDLQARRIESRFRIYGSQTFGTVAPCWHVRAVSRWQLDRCILLSIGSTQASAEHDSKPLQGEDSKETLTWGIGVRGGLSYTFDTSWALFSRLDVLLVPAPPIVEANGREIWTYPYASAVVQVGLVYAFDVTHPTAKPPPAPLF